MLQAPEHFELIKRAQAGQPEAISELSEIAQVRVRTYVRRVILREEDVDEITSDTMLGMLSSLSKLRDPSRFWGWLYAIAGNRVKQSYRRPAQRPMSLTALEEDGQEPPSPDRDAVDRLHQQELAAHTQAALNELQVRYRMVLAMRFYEDLPHSAISEALGCSELTARVTFLRAKRAFLAALRRRGVKGAAIGLAVLSFGRLTAPAEAAVHVSVNTGSLSLPLTRILFNPKLGLVACACLTLSLTSVLRPSAVATTPYTPQPSMQMPVPTVGKITSSTMPFWVYYRCHGTYLGAQDSKRGDVYDNWLYFPEGPRGPHLSCASKMDPSTGSIVIITGHGLVKLMPDLKRAELRNDMSPFCHLHATMLPTDPADLSEFVAGVEGFGTHSLANKTNFTFERDPVTGIVSSGTEFVNGHQYVLQFDLITQGGPDLLNYQIPSDYKVVDLRDDAHQSEWAGFSITGTINTWPVRGGGRLPLTYTAGTGVSRNLVLVVADRWVLTDDGRQACVMTTTGQVLAAYAGGSFWQGMSRPWEGFHTASTLRRDAAQAGLRYEITRLPEKHVICSIWPGAKKQDAVFWGDFHLTELGDLVTSVRISSSERQISLDLAYTGGVDGSYTNVPKPDWGTQPPVIQSAPGPLWLDDVARLLEQQR